MAGVRSSGKRPRPLDFRPPATSPPLPCRGHSRRSAAWHGMRCTNRAACGGHTAAHGPGPLPGSPPYGVRVMVRAVSVTCPGQRRTPARRRPKESAERGGAASARRGPSPRPRWRRVRPRRRGHPCGSTGWASHEWERRLTGISERPCSAPLRRSSTPRARAGCRRAVARHAGVSPNAPYRHCHDKEALLAALATRGFTELGERLAAAAPGDDPARSSSPWRARRSTTRSTTRGCTASCSGSPAALTPTPSPPPTRRSPSWRSASRRSRNVSGARRC
ncbi:regulatory protein TetR [Streptomyces violaceusniger Tu 4113]|uniref:Regulatory protein TetR n=1 Tax=Streptomyces violaceusniger (strain Tu 4113) TaxID=653045 RepID=G2NUL3_STRV4|nr:regulatory protein TetR [Streptomyces violaceusniger Tu 4113]